MDRVAEMRRLLPLLLLALGSVARPAAAQPVIAPAEISKRLCNVIGSEKGSLDNELWKIIGLTGQEAEDIRDRRVAQWMKARAAMGRDASGLYCDGAFPGFKGHLYRLALAYEDYQRLWELTKLGLDPNLPDSVTGKTAVDEIVEDIDLQLREDEQVIAPWRRLVPLAGGPLKPVRSKLLAKHRAYRTLREAGGRLAGEALQRPRSDCAATAADAPAPGIPYDGQYLSGGSGPTPQAIPGVTTVSARQAACLLDLHGKDMLVLGILRDPVALPGSYDFSFAGYGSGEHDQKVQSVLSSDLGALQDFTAKIKKNRPILVYCHHEQCRNSYNAALRLIRDGHRRVFWMREGLKAWKAGGYPLGGLIPRGPIKPLERY